jgi:hypothetical protein
MWSQFSPRLLAATAAAAHSLLQLSDDAGYPVYFELLTGEHKTGKGLLAEAAVYKDPKKLAQIELEGGLGSIPFGEAVRPLNLSLWFARSLIKIRLSGSL